MAQVFKVCLIGESGSGKTTLQTRIREGEFVDRHDATLGVEIHPITFMLNTNINKKVCFNVWDCAGKEEYGGLRSGYYSHSDAGIFFFESMKGMDMVIDEIKIFKHMNPNAIVIICLSKIDDVDHINFYKHMGFEEKSKMFSDVVYLISSKSNYQLIDPFLFIVRHYCGDNATLSPCS